MKTLKKTLTLLLLITAIALSNCSKENSTTVDVTVLEKGSNTPVVGATVNLVYSSSGGVFASSIVEQTKATDANGKVSFKAQDEKRSYSVGVIAGADYFGEGIKINTGENNRITLYIYPFAYVRVHAKNVNPFDSNDRINVGGEFSIWDDNRYYCNPRSF